MDEDIGDMIDDCLKRNKKLSEWEQSFVGNIYKSYHEGKPLSDKQYNALNEIWDRIT